ncbi:MAG: alpha/beta hydrolase, partial [Candidatus Promineifilaceae bacterium]
MQFAIDYPHLVRSLTFVSPVSPYGFGGTKDVAGTPNYADFAGSGGGVVNPEFVRRIKEGDRSAEDPNSPRNVISTFYYHGEFKAEREEAFLDAALLEKMGDDRYPGDMTPSENWPNVAPGRWGPINATSPKFFNTSGITEIENKPPVLWVRGDSDLIVSDGSMFDFGTLGQMGFVPGWPGADVYPPQPMVSQMRDVLDQYAAKGGRYQEVVVPNTAHSPHIEAPETFNTTFLAFLQES